MTTSTTVRARVKPAVKHKAEIILHQLGLSTSDAIKLFLYQVMLCNGLPFKVNIPNQVTSETFSDTDKGVGLTVCENAEDMFKKLGI